VTALRLAHRGDWRAAPENTLAAFTAALRIPGCDGLEFDVHRSRDGRAVLLHDDDLQRVQGVRAMANELSAAELSGHGIPTLAETLATVGEAPFLDVELKEWVPDAIDVLVTARGAGLKRAVISCFEDDVIAEVRRVRPHWATWLNSETLDSSVVKRAVDLGCRGISAEWATLTAALVAEVAEAGLDLATWTVRRRPTYRRLERLGVVAICAEASALDG
jgi:glycerophosphoryl diester phosphodiesterase